MLLSIGAFTLAAILIVLLPGPDTMVVLRNLVRGGRVTAFRTVLGVLSGLTIWVITAALGLSAVLRTSHDAYLVLRIVGAAYLLWLGVQSLRSRTAGSVNPTTDVPVRKRRALTGSGYPAGLATDLLNPKVGVFFVTFLPGFVPHGYPVGVMSLILGGIFVVLTAAYFAALLAISGRVTTWMSTARIRRRMDRTTGLVLIGLGLRLALEP
jgi:threonine/homoserine/homoserine lactone efflux protein